MSAWLRVAGDGVALSLHVQPGAKRTETAGLHGEALKIRLAAPPVEGRANDALIDFLSRALAVPKARITLVAGHASRIKRVSIAGINASLVMQKLSPAAKTD